MKKCTLLFLITSAIFFCTGISECNANDKHGIIFDQSSGGSVDFKSIPVYVITKMEAGPRLSGGKITLPYGQYIIEGDEEKLTNVTGYSLSELFKFGLKSYGIKENKYSIKRITRYATNESQTILYVFDYE